MSRTGWAVDAAGHLLAALWAIQGNRSVEADQAFRETGQAYRLLLFCIGTIPVDRTGWVYDVTVTRGMTIPEALAEIGA